MKTITLYENRYTDSLMGRKIRYSEEPISDDFEKIEIELPDFVEIYLNDLGDLCFKIKELRFFLNELLIADTDYNPVIRWTDDKGDCFYRLTHRTISE